MPDAFSQTDREVCRSMANAVATALEKANLFAAMERVNVQLTGLHQVAQLQDFDDVLIKTLESVQAVLGEESSSSIVLYDKNADTFSGYQALGFLEPYLHDQPREKGTSRYVLETKSAIYINNVSVPPVGYPPIREELMENGVKSYAAIPLKQQDEIVGVLFLALQKHFSFSPEVKKVLDLFAGQAAIAIKNAELLRKLQEEAIENTRLFGDLQEEFEFTDALSQLGQDFADLV